MWKSDSPGACSECGGSLTLETWGGLCIMCHQVFCERHVQIRNGVANCAACDQARRHREEEGPISQADADRVSRLLGHDLDETIGPGHQAAVKEAVARIRLFADGSEHFEQQVVDDVQQLLHDTFVDTSWPPCPEHPYAPY